MTPAARTQAAIELLDAIILAAREGGAAADVLIARYFSKRRYAGSKDRRAVREIVYAAIRACGEVPASGRAAVLALRDDALTATFDGSAHGPLPVVGEGLVSGSGVVPAWLGARLQASGVDEADWPALVDRAPLDIRVRRGLSIDQGEPIAGLAQGRRLAAGTDVAPLAGSVEVQDAGSHAVSLAARAAPGMTVIDLCAGAGGKTLAIGDAMDGRGRIVACDIDRPRLSKLMPRAEKAKLSIVETRLLNPNRESEALGDLTGAADVVFVDAPCSGTGTWRRNPEARWRLTPARLDRYAAMQAHVLAVAAPLVRAGGALVYVVCSLLDVEGKDRVAAFLDAHPGWSAEPLDLPFGTPHGAGRRLTPARDRTDGFFVARLLAPC